MAMRSLRKPLLGAFTPPSYASSRLLLVHARSESSARSMPGSFAQADGSSSSSSSSSAFFSSYTKTGAGNEALSPFSPSDHAIVGNRPYLPSELPGNTVTPSSAAMVTTKSHIWLQGSSCTSKISSLYGSASSKLHQHHRLLHSEQVMDEDSDSNREDASVHNGSDWESAQENNIINLRATKPGSDKPRIVVLGTGWAASRLMKDLNTELCDIVCISPRNHMVFTPLLASTCVGTLEFRSVTEPATCIQSALSQSLNSHFLLGCCTSIDPQKREVHCTSTLDNGSSNAYTVAYDKLVIAAGAQALTFNIKGVNENAIFLREVSDARSIRRRLLSNLTLSELLEAEEAKRRLLHCVVVGGGPTGVEFSGELSDFIKRDVQRSYAHARDYMSVTLIEAKEILSSFDVGLRSYAIKHLTKAGVKLVQGVVKDVHSKKLVLSDGSEVPYGLLVWSTGVGPSEFVKSLNLPKSRDGRIGVDDRMRVPGYVDMYAIGDCAGFVESVGKPVLPALAQVAERQGKYLAIELNKILKAGGGHAGGLAFVESAPFVYKHLGSMASVGSYKALIDLSQSKESKGFTWAGFFSWLVWRSAYLTRLVSWRNRTNVAINWATTFVFGRDVSRI